jgi:hypothetical protein
VPELAQAQEISNPSSRACAIVKQPSNRLSLNPEIGQARRKISFGFHRIYGKNLFSQLHVQSAQPVELFLFSQKKY